MYKMEIEIDRIEIENTGTKWSDRQRKLYRQSDDCQWSKRQKRQSRYTEMAVQNKLLAKAPGAQSLD